MELRDRERKIDISKMSPEEVDNLSVQIGAKVRELCDEAANKVNAVLNIYGMSAKMAIAFDELPKEMKNKFDTPIKKQRKSRKNNLKEVKASAKKA